LKRGFGPRSRNPDHASAGELALLAPTDGTASSHEGRKKPKWIPINESALRDVEAAVIGQRIVVFEAATGSDEASDRRLGGTLAGSAELFWTCSKPAG
jgi:hypothetical protein